jgi:hypothetical protein
MQNPHLIVDPVTKRCLCGIYNVGGEKKPVACADIHQAAAKLANLGSPEGLLLAVVLREQLVDCE